MMTSSVLIYLYRCTSTFSDFRTCSLLFLLTLTNILNANLAFFTVGSGGVKFAKLVIVIIAIVGIFAVFVLFIMCFLKYCVDKKIKLLGITGYYQRVSSYISNFPTTALDDAYDNYVRLYILLLLFVLLLSYVCVFIYIVLTVETFTCIYAHVIFIYIVLYLL